MEKEIEGKQIVSRLGIAPFKLVEYMKQGLPAYTQSGKKVYDTVYDDEEFDLPAYLTDHGIEVVKTKQHGTRTLYCLKHCINDHSHVNNDAAIGQAADGILFYQCFHNSCKGVTWHKVRQKIVSEPSIKPTLQERMEADRRWAIHEMSRKRPHQDGIPNDISSDPFGWHGINLSLPQDEEKANEIINDVLGFYFLVNDYEEFAKKHALKSLLNRNQEDRQELHKAIFDRGDGRYTENGVDHELQNNQAKNNSFKLKCDFWEIQYKGDSANLRDRERMRYIVHLLANPNKQFLAHYLASLVKKNEPAATEKYNKLSNEQLQIEGLSRSEHSAEGLSEEEYERLKNQARTLWDRTFITPDNEKANQDWQELKNYMQNQHGVLVNDRGENLKFIIKSRLNKDNERARSNVQKRIVAAIKDIRTHLPSLADHLSRTIKTGRICIYETESNNSMNWDISW